MNRLFTFALLVGTAFAAPPQLQQHPVTHHSQFTSLNCGFVTDPEPTNSPNPVALNAPVVVDFLISEDGKVHSPFLRQSSGSYAQDRALINLVKSWRYRPSLCNDMPSNSEAIVTFIP
jgi:TonB family protein